MVLRRVGVRTAWLLASLLLASLLIFAATNALPGDIAQVMLGTNATPGEAEALRERLGLNRPFLVRYLEWLWAAVRGNFGVSYISGRSVGSLIASRLSVSVWLAGLGMIFAVLLALPIGAYAAMRRRHLDGAVVSALSQVGLAVPAFWAGIWLVIIFAVTLGWFPAGGYVSYFDGVGRWASHLALPVASLAVVQASVISRYVRSAVIEVSHEDYFRTARAVGWSRAGALWRHGLRNIGISLLTVIGLQLATLLVGAIIIEQVFALPGLGSTLLLAVSQRDLGIVQAIVLLMVWAVLLINFLVDVAYQLVDPRLRRGGEIR
ncbi:ABC transporter permease [Tessaracoccus flavus]|jgi:peptide/nickel transport system permease protein|uniref:ABC transporter permease n=1 Tax=Tessaracoccus flavus TaxID=1610493 RepID=A0A1Q2CET8_9ACTN|nr:ABC transporter permease [Tessaracoccus flavus]AQP44565.1 ABC transporter permease [Tessaracoccus flavus]SDZ09620.1 peptide/nickel transport system permease protein [Tessaracoccus flavus]